MYFEMESVHQSYADLVNHVRIHGDIAVSRGMMHHELVGVQVRLLNPVFSLATDVGRRLNVRIAFVEALQLISGEYFGELLDKVSHGAFRRYFNGEEMHGSYGPRLRPQLRTAVDKLGMTDNRQVVMTIWDPLRDQVGDRNDVPCTVALQFLLRGNKLHMVTTMRSNDVWRGFPYDIFQFTQLQCTIANAIGCAPGDYVHNVGSLHLYESDIDEVQHLKSREPEAKDVFGGMEPTQDWNGAGPTARFEVAQRAACSVLSVASGIQPHALYLPAPGLHYKATQVLLDGS